MIKIPYKSRDPAFLFNDKSQLLLIFNREVEGNHVQRSRDHISIERL